MDNINLNPYTDSETKTTPITIEVPESVYQRLKETAKSLGKNIFETCQILIGLGFESLSKIQEEKGEAALNEIF